MVQTVHRSVNGLQYGASNGPKLTSPVFLWGILSQKTVEDKMAGTILNSLWTF